MWYAACRRWRLEQARAYLLFTFKKLFSPLLAYHDLTHPQAGRLPQLDELASQFFLTSGAARDAIYKQASELAASIGPSAKHYVRVMEKVSNGSEEYFEKESKRYVALPSSLPSFLPSSLPYLFCHLQVYVFKLLTVLMHDWSCC